MHIEKYTKIPLDDSGENFLYLKNHCLGTIKAIGGEDFVLNKKTGERYNNISLYEQVVDENGQPLEKPITGDNSDFVLLNNGEETLLVDFFQKLWNSSNTDSEKSKNEGK